MLVPSGMYSVGSLSGENQVDTAVCPVGDFCQMGRKQECPFTRYGSETGLSVASCTGRCSNGCVCDTGSIKPCPTTLSGANEYVFPIASIGFLAVQLNGNPLPENDDDILRSTIEKLSSTFEEMALFQFPIPAALYPTKWNTNIGYRIVIEFRERSNDDDELEFKIVGLFGWGCVVIVDGVTKSPRAAKSEVEFSFKSTFGLHKIEIYAAEKKLTANVERTILFRRTVGSSVGPFNILRADRLDGQIVYQSLKARACVQSLNCPHSYVVFNGIQIYEKKIQANIITVLTLGDSGSVLTIQDYVESEFEVLRVDLSSYATEKCAIILATSLTSTLPGVLTTEILRFGGNFRTVSNHMGAFIILGCKDIPRPWSAYSTARNSRIHADLIIDFPAEAGRQMMR